MKTYLWSFLSMCLIFVACSEKTETIDPIRGNAEFICVTGPETIGGMYGYLSTGKLYDDGLFYSSYASIQPCVMESMPVDIKKYVRMGVLSNGHRYEIYLYYLYSLQASVTTETSLEFLSGGLCRYKEVQSVKDAVWKKQCTMCTTQDYDCADEVGSEETIRLTPKSSPRVRFDRTYSVTKYESVSPKDPYCCLYSDDTMIDVYLSGSEVHLVQRLPSSKDLGTLKLRK